MLVTEISEEHIRRSQRVALAALREHGAMTIDELMERLPPKQEGFPWSDSRIRSACSELAKQGLAYKTGERRLSKRGFTASVWNAKRVMKEDSYE